ncbi:uncharacterized protein KRP23_10677 [Phytophthora ramorum]|uniref:uncharacterized protein n=1 Tax=Phytophthora ramorum TaxID=164328 RepID=UPI0030ABD5FF|nr:hypothetical protein KRP23_10677 [Phytophthora ramorum]
MKVLSPSSILAIASLAAGVHGHGYISQPKATYEPNTIYTTYNKLTTASINSGFDGGHYNWSPTQNAQAFIDHWNATGYKSLRDMLDPIAPGYGHSLETADPVDVSGYKEMWWQNDEYKEGFIASHEGPCEAWVDDRLFLAHDPVFGLGRTAASTDNGASEAEQTTTTAPVATTATPTATTATPEASTDDGSSSVTQTAASTADEASSGEQMATTPAPEVTTAAPETAPVSTPATPTATEATTSSSKCVRRRS